MSEELITRLIIARGSVNEVAVRVLEETVKKLEERVRKAESRLKRLQDAVDRHKSYVWGDTHALDWFKERADEELYKVREEKNDNM